MVQGTCIILGSVIRYTTDSIRLLDRMDLLRIRAEKTTEFRWQNENIERVFKRKSDKA